MDYQTIINKKKKIVNSRMRAIPEDVVNDTIIPTHHKRNAKSEALYHKAVKLIPAGLEHNLGLLKPFPLTMKRAEGCSIWDVDGNKYVDYLMDGGPIILGQHFKELDDKVTAYIQENGPSTGLTSENELLCAEEIIKHYPSVEMIRFVASGTEADLVAIRLARLYTGKKKLIKIGGSYHGWSDQLLVSTDYPSMGTVNSSGVPAVCLENTIDVRPNDFDGLKAAFEAAKKDGGVAAIITEATGGHAGTFPVHPDWNQFMRDTCDEYGALLIFDEVVAGFRIAMGGGQEYYKVNADITVMGKIITHGYPSCGAFGARKEIMDLCHPSGETGHKAYVGGTMSANPISTLAGYLAIQYIEKYDAIGKASAYGDKFAAELNHMFEARPDLPYFVYNIGPIVHVETTCPSGVFMVTEDHDRQVAEQNARAKAAAAIQLALQNEDVLMLCDSKRFYCCMAHNDEALDNTLRAWEKVLAMIPAE